MFLLTVYSGLCFLVLDFIFIVFLIKLFVLLDLLEVVMGSMLGIIMNGTLLGQIILYQKPQAKKEKKEE